MKADFRGAMVAAAVAAARALGSWSAAGCLGMVDSLPRMGRAICLSRGTGDGRARIDLWG